MVFEDGPAVEDRWGNMLANNTFERTAGSRSLAAAAQRGRYVSSLEGKLLLPPSRPVYLWCARVSR